VAVATRVLRSLLISSSPSACYRRARQSNAVQYYYNYYDWNEASCRIGRIIQASLLRPALLSMSGPSSTHRSRHRTLLPRSMAVMLMAPRCRPARTRLPRSSLCFVARGSCPRTGATWDCTQAHAAMSLPVLPGDRHHRLLGARIASAPVSAHIWAHTLQQLRATLHLAALKTTDVLQRQNKHGDCAPQALVRRAPRVADCRHDRHLATVCP
jgi:hypothetical protein